MECEHDGNIQPYLTQLRLNTNKACVCLKEKQNSLNIFIAVHADTWAHGHSYTQTHRHIVHTTPEHIEFTLKTYKLSYHTQMEY